ncbi:hypothetical protein OOT46_29905 [Aquabacterium sp. A7-Y]|uniref:hypothetical protein n=1 Tax=Aquabacterium sp. A7-Y TaxID=1349605 RepID=UPI00223E1ECA|nr:hypothetical protein [Aquabacterium sp. A7-Y]MCW7542016.1 hypothetical protein [Aquabacterium sp. A7-Y]
MELDIARRTWTWVVEHRKDVIYRVGVGLLLYVWLRLYPSYLLLVYSAKRGFLSFDVLAEGMLGMNTVLTWTGFMLLALSFYQWGLLALLTLRRRIDLKVPRPAWIFMTVMALVVWIPFGLLAFFGKERTWVLLGAFSIFSLALCVSLTLFFRKTVAEAAINWVAPLFLLAVSLFLPALGHDFTAEIMDTGFRQYRVGGQLPVKVGRIEDGAASPQTITGRLLMLGVRNVYIDTGSPEKPILVVIPNAQNLKIEIGKRRTDAVAADPVPAV